MVNEMFSERNGSPSSIKKVEAKEYVCIKTSVTQIKTSANLGGTSKYQAAYNKSSYPRSIFNKNVGNFLDRETKYGGGFKNNIVNRTLIVPKPPKNQPTSKANSISVPPKKQEGIGKNIAANKKSENNTRDHLNSPKLPNSITNKLYKVRHIYVYDNE